MEKEIKIEESLLLFLFDWQLKKKLCGSLKLPKD